jgi:hypothetical protein
VPARPGQGRGPHAVAGRHATNLVDAAREAKAMAIESFKGYKELPDPPSLSDALAAAVMHEIFSQIPGGRLLKLGMQTAVFADDLDGLRADLAARGTTSLFNVGKAVYGAMGGGAAGKALGDVKELAGFRSEAVADWASARDRIRHQKTQVLEWLHTAAEGTENRGRLRAKVVQHLGPAPGDAAPMIAPASERFELELYRRNLQRRGAALVEEENEFGELSGALELYVGGEPITRALRGRIAEIAAPRLEPDDTEALARLLGLPRKRAVPKPGAWRFH